MAIKAGTILHDARGFVIDRIQQGGVSSLNIPQEKIYELGNYQSVATIRDIPDLAFDVEQTDVSTEMEAILCGKDPTTVNNGDKLDFATSVPFDIISPFRAGAGAFNIVKGIAIPYLTLDSVSYKYGVKANASQTFTLAGDSVYYIPGSPYYEEISLIGAQLTYSFAHTAILYVEQGLNIYALSACVKNPSTGAYKRLFPGTGADTGYTSTSTTITTVTDWQAQGYTILHVTYGSATAATYNQAKNASAAVKPAAIKAKDICVYVSDGNATPTLVRWTGVQSLDVTRKVTLDKDEEFCNPKYVGQDYDVADVTGSIGVKSVDAADLWTKIAQIADVPTNQVAGVYSSIPLQIQAQLKDPDTGTVLKTIVVPDARFTLPNVHATQQQKLEVTFPFQSDGGLIYIYKGTP